MLSQSPSLRQTPHSPGGTPLAAGAKDRSPCASSIADSPGGSNSTFESQSIDVMLSHALSDKFRSVRDSEGGRDSVAPSEWNDGSSDGSLCSPQALSPLAAGGNFKASDEPVVVRSSARSSPRPRTLSVSAGGRSRQNSKQSADASAGKENQPVVMPTPQRKVLLGQLKRFNKTDASSPGGESPREWAIETRLVNPAVVPCCSC